MNYSDIPNVNTLLGLPILQGLSPEWALSVVQACTTNVRMQIAKGALDAIWTMDDWSEALESRILELRQKRYRPVINATGIVVHTNLGRAPLAPEVIEYMASVSQYTDLELRLDDGKRGGRLEGIQQKLCQMTGAEAAVVVNNNAAAVLLLLSAMASGKEVVVSRGELVEIGGSFRVPDVIQQGGARLREVGCTNRLHLKDIEAVLSEETAAILRVHTSNYRIVGFTSSPSREEICRLGRSHGIPVVEDLGSGLLSKAPNVPWKETLEHEESIANALEEGVDVVCASGDKLLGGVQAGLILGKKKWIEKCRQHPLYRALRLDKIILAGLEATLQMHFEGRSRELPVWEYLERSSGFCKELATRLAHGVENASAVQSESLVGGGALPDRRLETWAVKISHDAVDELACTLRTGNPAIMARVQKDAVWLDVRTIPVASIETVRLRLIELLNTNGEV